MTKKITDEYLEVKRVDVEVKSESQTMTSSFCYSSDCLLCHITETKLTRAFTAENEKFSIFWRVKTTIAMMDTGTHHTVGAEIVDA